MQDLAENFDNSVREDDSEDTRNSLTADRGDTEGEIDEKLKDFNDLFCKNVISLLQVPERKEDKLKPKFFRQYDHISVINFTYVSLLH